MKLPFATGLLASLLWLAAAMPLHFRAVLVRHVVAIGAKRGAN